MKASPLTTVAVKPNAKPNLLTRIRIQIGLRPSPSANVWMSMGFLALFLAWVGYRLLDRQGLLLGFFAALFINALVFFYEDWRISALFPFTEPEGGDGWGILRLTGQIAERLGASRPTVRILALETPCAFTSGLFAPRSRLYVSEGLLRRFGDTEVRAVLIAELLRIKNGQAAVATATVSIAGLVALVGNAIDSILLAPFYFFFSNETRPRRFHRSGPVTLLTSPLIALCLRTFAHRRTEQIELDKEVSESLATIDGTSSHAKQVWARTLAKLDAYGKTLPIDVSLADAGLFSVHPLAWTGAYSFSRPQAPIAERIRALTGHSTL